MRRLSGIATILLSLLGLGWAGCARQTMPGDPLRGLTRAQRESFQRGKSVFGHTFTPESGLGPLFNSTSSAECHEGPAPGGVGDEIELHAAIVRSDSNRVSLIELHEDRAPGGVGDDIAALARADGSCDALVDSGGFVFQQHVTPALEAALGITSEPVPKGATTGRRTTPDLFGFGLLDAVPDAMILAYADPDDRDHDGISGRTNHASDGRLGRFGRKALVPTLAEFNAGGFLAELGVTNPVDSTEGTVGGRPIPAGVDPTPEPELSADSLRATDDFVRFLAPPARVQVSSAARFGEQVFSQIRCDACHVPYLRTGRSDVKALAHRRVYAYTDLLLHDMGPDLADICLGEASPAEFRTEPLMGLRFETQLLHDGRATSIEEAIRLHGGEGAAARDRFVALPERKRAALLAFLGGL